MFTNRSAQVQADQKMIAGIEAHMTQLTSLSVGSQEMTPADMVKFFQDRLDAAKAVVDAAAALATAIKAERDLRAKTSTLRSAFCRIVVGMFFHSPDTLAAFGLKAPRVGTIDAAKRAAAVAKGKATRVARHTLGKKAKLAIKGSLATPNA